jgi:hypothetical protein
MKEKAGAGKSNRLNFDNPVRRGQAEVLPSFCFLLEQAPAKSFCQPPVFSRLTEALLYSAPLGSYGISRALSGSFRFRSAAITWPAASSALFKPNLLKPVWFWKGLKPARLSLPASV